VQHQIAIARSNMGMTQLWYNGSMQSIGSSSWTLANQAYAKNTGVSLFST